jgi:photosystem II stability/assembly factor-like uncharacterized protein
MNDRAWVATRKGLFELRKGTSGWRIANVSFLGEPVSMVLPPTSSGRMLAALNLGHFGVKVHASDDGGKSWNEVATPTYPEQPADAKGPAWKMVQIWSMEARNGTVWAGTLPGGLFRSDDGGASWTLNDALWNRPERVEWFGGGYDVPGIHSICPHPTRDGELLVGVSCGGVWITRDDGQTWSVHCDGMHAAYMPPDQADNPNTQDPHRVVRCASAPDVLWTQHHCGIWKSADNAGRWEEVKAPLSSFGFAVAVHPSRPETAWFVPGVADQQRIPVEGQLVVNRTRDGGKSFETLREGLPQEACYDLTYRHGLDIAPDGEQLLMGTTTGSLWATTNGGDSWSTVSNHLPPIYAVRFG